MDFLIGIAFLYAVGYCAYKSGKHLGSRKGYAVGRSRRG